jgi:vacuolar-type H+-ATPase subunit H
MLPTGFALNRPRLQLTGLEEPEELLERLNEARAQQQNLAQINRKLRARVKMLERQLAEAGGLTDEELVAELPKRMGKALESAQDVASELIRRARNTEAAIHQKATESAAQITHQAEEQAAKVMEQTRKEAASHRAKAEAEAQAVIAAAQQEASRLQQRIAVLRRDEARVVHAYDVVERTLAEARRTLRQAEADASPEPAPAPSTGAAPARRDRPKPVAVRPVLYDWSPPVTNAG